MASEIISNLNSALPTGPNSNNAVPLGVFGGESVGFASDVADSVGQTFYSKRFEPDAYTVAKGMDAPVPRSIFNEYALFNFRGMYGGLTGGLPFSYFLDGPDNPLMGGEDAHNVSIAKIVEFFDTHYPKIAYKYQDFLYLKYYKQIPVNHLVTLRRFPTPVNDNIFDITLQTASGGGTDKNGAAIPVANESVPGSEKIAGCHFALA